MRVYPIVETENNRDFTILRLPSNLRIRLSPDETRRLAYEMMWAVNVLDELRAGRTMSAAILRKYCGPHDVKQKP